MNKEQIKQQQDNLDNTIIKCPKCGEEQSWGLYREIGCEKAFIEWHKKEGHFNEKVECQTCGTIKESMPTPDGDEVCPSCGDREMLDKE